jgi:hypothetical protein
MSQKSFVQQWLIFSCRKGDYHRYLAEFASGDKRKTAATAAHEAYKVRTVDPTTSDLR